MEEPPITTTPGCLRTDDFPALEFMINKLYITLGIPVSSLLQLDQVHILFRFSELFRRIELLSSSFYSMCKGHFKPNGEIIPPGLPPSKIHHLQWALRSSVSITNIYIGMRVLTSQEGDPSANLDILAEIIEGAGLNRRLLMLWDAYVLMYRPKGLAKRIADAVMQQRTARFYAIVKHTEKVMKEMMDPVGLWWISHLPPTAAGIDQYLTMAGAQMTDYSPRPGTPDYSPPRSRSGSALDEEMMSDKHTMHRSPTTNIIPQRRTSTSPRSGALSPGIVDDGQSSQPTLFSIRPTLGAEHEPIVRPRFEGAMPSKVNSQTVMHTRFMPGIGISFKPEMTSDNQLNMRSQEPTDTVIHTSTTTHLNTLKSVYSQLPSANQTSPIPQDAIGGHVGYFEQIGAGSRMLAHSQPNVNLQMTRDWLVNIGEDRLPTSRLQHSSHAGENLYIKVGLQAPTNRQAASREAFTSQQRPATQQLLSGPEWHMPLQTTSTTTPTVEDIHASIAIMGQEHLTNQEPQEGLTRPLVHLSSLSCVGEDASQGGAIENPWDDAMFMRDCEE